MMKSRKFPRGRWEHSDFFADVHTAYEWGHKRMETYWRLPEEERAIMRQYVLTVRAMEVWEYEMDRPTEPNKTKVT